MFYRRTGNNKYNAKKTIFNNRVYDSKAEADLAQYLFALQKKGEIDSIEPQVTFQLRGKGGTVIAKHIVDFLVSYKDGQDNKGGHQEVFECKGQELPAWKLKRKLFIDNYPDIQYRVFKNGIEVEYGKKKQT